ncbi:MAG: ClC family H(+)/Cl(-) exchange transporter [Bacillota bacterium]
MVLAKQEITTSATLNHWRELRLRIILEGMAVGLLTGAVVVAYKLLFEEAESLRNKVYTLISQEGSKAGLLWCILLVIVSYLLGLIVSKVPLLGGSGIPQVKAQLLNQLKVNWFKVLIWKFTGGIMAIFTGLSLGSGGPSVQMGACVGQGVSRSLGRLKVEEKYLITSGACAGLAAIFNAPLAGVIFALEEMHKNFSPIALTSAMAASLTADFVSRHFFGQEPIFKFESLPVLPFDYYIYLIILGVLIGLLGAAFNSALKKTLDVYAILPVKLLYKPVIPVLIAFVLGFYLPQTLGAGYQLMGLLQSGDFTFTFLLILFLFKFAFTMISYGSGVPGGIFLPLLVIGALAGAAYGVIAAEYLNVSAEFSNNFIVLSMAAIFTAVFKAPITGSILITEMTGSFSHLYAMITVSLAAYIATDILNSKSIYDDLMRRALENYGKNITGDQKVKVILESYVCLGAEIDSKRIKDIQWPNDSLLVAIRRGEREIIPKGNTIIRAGDLIVLLTNEDQEQIVQSLLTKMSNYQGGE